MIAGGRVTHEDVFHTLHEVATAAAGGADSGQIAQLAVTQCRRLLEVGGTALGWLDDASGELSLLASDTLHPKDLPVRIPLTGSLVGRAILEGRTVSTSDGEAECGVMELAREMGISSFLVVPLMVGTRAVGGISVFSYSPRSFTEEERHLIELLAAVVGPALESARLARRRELEARRLRELHEFAVEAAGELDLVRLSEAACDRVKSALGCDAATVVLWDEKDSVLRTITRDDGYGLGRVVPPESKAIIPCFREGAPVVVNDYRARYGTPGQDLPQALACVPLIAQGRAIGVLAVADSAEVRFGPEEMRFLLLIAAQLSPAMEAGRLNYEILHSGSRLWQAYQLMACGVLQGSLGEPLDLNEAARDILGPEVTAALLARDFSAITFWDESGTRLDPRQWPFIRVARGEGPMRGATYRVAAGDGRPVWIHGDAVPITDDQGRVVRVIASFVDITAMKVAEDSLRKNAALFEEAFDNSVLGMHITSVEDGRIIQANRALHTVLGLERGTLIGTSIDELARLGGDVAETAERRRLLVEGQVQRIHHRRVIGTGDGRTITVDVTVGLVRDEQGAPLFTVTQIADVTRQVNVEVLLRDEVERMGEIVRTQTEVYEADADVESTLQMLAEKARLLTNAEGAVVSLLDGSLITSLAFSGDRGAHPLAGEDLGTTFEATCLRLGETIFTGDAPNDPRVDQVRARISGVGSLAATPLRQDGRSIGVIQVGSQRRDAFGQREVRTLELFAGLATAAISRAAIVAAMREGEERISALVASAPMMVFSADTDARVTLILGQSPTGRALDATRFVGRPVTRAFPRRPDLADGIGSALDGRACVRLGADSSRGRDYETHFSPIHDSAGNVAGAIAVSLDVTEKHRSERELAESRTRLSAVVAAAPVITFAFDRDGTVLLAEGAALARLGLRPEVARGRSVFEAFNEAPEVAEHFRRGVRGESFEGVIHLDAFQADFDVRYGPIFNADGLVIGMSGMGTDITDRARMEAATRENDAKTRLMAMMNHEVRTPLNSVLGFAELMSSGRTGELTSKQARYVANIEAAGRHLLSLVNDSLDLAKLDADKMPLVMVDLELAPILEQALGQLHPLAEARGLELRAECPAGISVSADRRRLLQVLWNLVSNSIKHSTSGGTVTLRGTAAGGRIQIEVIDSGSGIPPDQLEKIFEEFHQVGPSQVEGTGLGLTLCRRLVALMGGSIGVESKVGEGSKFTVTLRSETEPAAPGPAI